MSDAATLPPGLSPPEILRAASLAPSPDNNQPWRFAWEGGKLLVYLDPAQALPSDVNSMFDLAGVGAAVENAAIAARQQGFEAELAPEKGDGDNLCEAPSGPLRGKLSPSPFSGPDPSPRLAASVRFLPGARPDPLLPHLESRCTNRKLYSTAPVAESSLHRLAGEVGAFSEVQLEWITDRPRIDEFARIVKFSDRFRFEYRPFHREIFRQLRFSAAEAERTRDGLDVRTLELPPGAGLALRLLRPWPVMKLLNLTGLARLLTLPSLWSVRRSGALGVLSLSRPTPHEFLRGGQAFQRIWLAAEAEGLALQPLGSLAIFIAQMKQLQGRNLTPAHQVLSDQLGQWTRRLLPALEGRTLLMLFRLGQAPPPKVRSLRRPAEELMLARAT